MTRAPFPPLESRVLEAQTTGSSFVPAPPEGSPASSRLVPPASTAASITPAEQRCAGIRPDVLARVLQVIDQRFHEPLRVEDLGRHACLSPFHFARMFKISVGQAPHAYLTAKRMEHARQLLAETNVAIADVARRVGFRTQAHFSGVFRKQVGVTPGQYRRHNRPATDGVREG